MDELTFSYQRFGWGDMIYGSKDELQALGLADGMAFPGEAGGPKRVLKVIDPRGFPCQIEQFTKHTAGYYLASIHFPDRQPTHLLWDEVEVAPGVERLRCNWGDLYKGTAEALIVAGLIAGEHLPGPVGSGSATVSVRPDGTIWRHVKACRSDKEPGIRVVRRLRGGQFSVAITVDHEERERRLTAGWRDVQDYEERLRALPRPAPLVAKARQAEALARRSAIRLVWVRPPFVPTLTLPP